MEKMNQIHIYPGKDGVQLKVFKTADDKIAIQLYKMFSNGELTNVFTFKDIYSVRKLLMNDLFNHFEMKEEPQDKIVKVVDGNNCTKYSCKGTQITYFPNPNEKEPKIKIVNSFHNGSEWKDSNYWYEEDIPYLLKTYLMCVTDWCDKITAEWERLHLP